MPETSISGKPTPGNRAHRRSMATSLDLPPVLLHVGEDEILRDDARRYADLVVKSGSPAELHVWQGMVHVFPPISLSCMPRARLSISPATSFAQAHPLSDV
jgi:acetyl esterase/lipase